LWEWARGRVVIGVTGLPAPTISQITRNQLRGGRMRIRKLGVVGAGTMGGGIAALAVSAGIPVVLLDVPASSGPDRNTVVKGGVDRAKKSKPAAFMDLARASLIEIGNMDDDLGKLAQCDLVVEAIVEQVAPKRALYEKLEQLLPAHTVIATNTSGIPMSVLTE